MALANVVESGVPFHSTTELKLKPFPFTVSVNGCPAAAPVAGPNELMASVPTAKFSALELTPPTTTVIRAVPAAAIKLAGTEARNSVELTNVVVRLVLFQCTTAVEVKPTPVSVRVNGSPPMMAALGFNWLSTGTIVKDFASEVAPPELTVTLTVPALAVRLVGIAAVNLVALTKVVVTADPFHCTVALGAKPLPFTVSVTGPPAVAEVGFKVVIAGPGLIVKDALLEATPPTLTVTLTVPGLAITAAEMVAVN